MIFKLLRISLVKLELDIQSGHPTTKTIISVWQNLHPINLIKRSVLVGSIQLEMDGIDFEQPYFQHIRMKTPVCKTCMKLQLIKNEGDNTNQPRKVQSLPQDHNQPFHSTSLIFLMAY